MSLCEYVNAGATIAIVGYVSDVKALAAGRTFGPSDLEAPDPIGWAAAQVHGVGQGFGALAPGFYFGLSSTDERVTPRMAKDLFSRVMGNVAERY